MPGAVCSATWGGLYARGDTLYAFIQERGDLVHAPTPGMSAHDSMKGSMRNDLCATCNGQDWEMVKEGYADVLWMFENPRLTAEGRLMACHHQRPQAGRFPVVG